MSFYGKVYTSENKHENFDAWLKSAGIPDDKISAVLSEKSVNKIVQNGDSYVMTQTTPKGEKVISFKSGVEIDDTIGFDKTPVKSTFTVDGSTITQVIKSPIGTATIKRVYSGDECVVHFSSDKYDGVAKRYFKA